jgi:hypothetical protein
LSAMLFTDASFTNFGTVTFLHPLKQVVSNA